jgi:hypothetical protein
MGPILTDQDLTDMFDELLDEQGEVEVAGMMFSPSDILKKCDPIAYRIDRDNYADALIEDGYAIEGY